MERAETLLPVRRVSPCTSLSLRCIVLCCIAFRDSFCLVISLALTSKPGRGVSGFCVVAVASLDPYQRTVCCFGLLLHEPIFCFLLIISCCLNKFNRALRGMFKVSSPRGLYGTRLRKLFAIKVDMIGSFF